MILFLSVPVKCNFAASSYMCIKHKNAKEKLCSLANLLLRLHPVRPQIIGKNENKNNCTKDLFSWEFICLYILVEQHVLWPLDGVSETAAAIANMHAIPNKGHSRDIDPEFIANYQFSETNWGSALRCCIYIVLWGKCVRLHTM